MDRRTLLVTGAAAATGVIASQAAFAQGGSDFPNRPITLIVPWPAGGGTDIWHRALAEAASKVLGQPVIVDNKAGASGTAGPALMAATAKGDGYTISHVPIGILRLPIMQKVPYDPLRDFTWIIHLSGFLFATVVRADSPFKTLGDMVAWAKANPGMLTYGTPGAATSLHIGMEIMARHAGIKWTQVPFKGTSESLAAIEGGHIMALAGGTDWWPMLDAGKLRVLAVWSENRNPRLPDVPTLKEAGFPFVFDSPFGLAGPKGMDPTVVKKLHDAFKIAFDDPRAKEMQRRYEFVDRYMNSEDYTRFSKELYEKEKLYLAEIGLAKKE